jgi:hypothetical protein
MRLKLLGSIAAVGVIALAGCGGDDESDITAFCDKVKELEAAPSPFEGVAQGDIEGTKDAIEEAQGLLAEVAAVAPAEIQDDVDQAEAFFADFVEAIQDANSPKDLLAVSEEFQTQAQDYQAASERLNTYTEENCDINVDGGAAGTSDSG